MATQKHSAYSSGTTHLGTELNSLANNSNCSASSAHDNTSDLYLFEDLEIVIATQGSARSSGATIEVYITPSVDGTNYTDADEEISELVASFPLDAATTARRSVIRDVPIPPGNYKYFIRNRTGQALAASGNTLKGFRHNLQSV